jgi:hypothetical protein
LSGDQAFGCFAVGTTSGFYDTFFTEEFDSGVDVTFGFGEGFFTSNNTGVGVLRVFLYRGCVICNNSFWFFVVGLKNKRGGLNRRFSD